jgi:glucans biosynthesis protein C
MHQTNISPPDNLRRSDLDWLRLIAILILLFFHTGMWFNTWGWHVKNNEISTSFQYWMVWLHFWRMPLLLFISGAGTYLALGKRTVQQFAWERFKRLFIPLVFGILVIVPPQIFYERINQYSDYWDFYKTVFQLEPYPKGSFSWHHLWFVAYLFFYSLLLIPFLKFIRSEKSFSFKERTAKWLTNPWGMLLIPCLIIFITQLALRPFFPEETHDFTDLAFMVFYMTFFFLGIVCYSDKRVWHSIKNNRKSLLTTAILSAIPLYLFYFHLTGIIVLPVSEELADIFFSVIGSFLSWFTVIAVIGYGQHYLNKPHPWLKYTNEGLYPFYILHQTVIIAIGYYVCQWPWSIAAKYWTIAFLTLTSCFLIFLLFIQPFNWVRFLFGMKAKD